MAWCVNSFQLQLANHNNFIVLKVAALEFVITLFAAAHRGAGQRGQFSAPRNKIGVNMSFQDVRDTESIQMRKFQVNIYVPAGIDDGANSGGFISNNIRKMSQALGTDCFQYHFVPFDR